MPAEVKDAADTTAGTSPEPDRSLIRAAMTGSAKSGEPASETERLQHLIDVTDRLDRINDLDSMLDEVLAEARAFAHADAGTIYLVERDELRFAYNSQSITNQAASNANKYIYLDNTMPIDAGSIAGYVALNRETLVIDDCYAIASDAAYRFNASYDEKANYRTRSLLTVPLTSNRSNCVGVMQLINSIPPGQTEPGPFTAHDRLYVTLFGRNAAIALERAILTRSIILRMIKMSEFRDPKETGAHVNRVGAYSIEIYDQWARKRHVSEVELKRHKDLLRLGGMMHDVGKIAIPDAILKKPGPLTDQERLIMQGHTVIGARLFQDEQSGLDRVSEEIALTHHERWDGMGYPGQVQDLHSDPISMSEGKHGEAIPVFGRVVGLADVYDALSSRRTYKDAWDQNQVLKTIRRCAGTHFDPEIVDAFFEILDVINAIRGKYTD